MNVFLKITSLAAIVTLAGCTATLKMPEAPLPPEPEPVVETDPFESAEYLEQIDAVAKEMRGMCASSAFQSYFKKTACFPSGITEKQLKDRTHITREEKKVAVKLFALQHDLNARTRAIMMKSGDERMIRVAQLSKTRVMPEVEALQDALLSGALTWGEYNLARLRLFEENRQAPTDKPTNE